MPNWTLEFPNALIYTSADESLFRLEAHWRLCALPRRRLAGLARPARPAHNGPGVRRDRLGFRRRGVCAGVRGPRNGPGGILGAELLAIRAAAVDGVRLQPRQRRL